MRASLYARVSTDEQANRDNSIPAQIRALREYCKKNDITIYNEYIDEGVSGQKENRPAFQKMLSDAHNGCFDIILVHKFDRFARKIELSRKIKTDLNTLNINVISITEPIENSPMGFFMEGLHELMAEYYVKNLVAEVKKGMNERAMKGKHMGQMPYGYYCANGNVFINEEQATIVKKIFELYLNGYGQFKIAKWLNENSIPTYKGIIGGWQSFQVAHILKNYKYIGKNYWNGNLYDAEFPSILSDELFYKVNTRVAEQGEKHRYRGDNFSQYFLLELLYCGECGSPMRIKVNHEWGGKKVKKYTCRSASQYRKGCTFSKLFNAEKLESEIETFLKNIINGESAVNLNIVEEKPLDVSDIKQKQLQKITTELERAKHAYVEGVFDLSEYKELKQTLEKQKLKIEKELSVQVDDLAEERKGQELLKKIESVWDLYMQVDTANEKREILKTFIKRIDVYRDRFNITFYV